MTYKNTLPNLNNFHRGWIVGKFDGAITDSIDEVGIQSYSAGNATLPHCHSNSIEYNVVISGQCEFIVYDFRDMSKKRKIIKANTGDIIKIDKYIVCKLIAITDTTILCLRHGCGLDKINISDKQFYSHDDLEVSA